MGIVSEADGELSTFSWLIEAKSVSTHENKRGKELIPRRIDRCFHRPEAYFVQLST